METIIVRFDNGERGLIARATSDNGAWVVPGRQERHVQQPTVGHFAVEVTGQSANGRLRFCRIIESEHSAIRRALEGEAKPDWSGCRASMLWFGHEISFGLDLESGTIGSPSTEEMGLLMRARPLPQLRGSRLETMAMEVKATFEKRREEEEVARKAKIVAIAEWAKTHRDDPRLLALGAVIKDRISRPCSGNVSKDELQGFDGYVEGACQIVKLLSDGRARLGWQNVNGVDYWSIFAEDHDEDKESVLAANPAIQASQDDPKFWEKVAVKIGTRVGETREYHGYGISSHGIIWAVPVGDIFVRVYTHSHTEEDEEQAPYQ